MHVQRFVKQVSYLTRTFAFYIHREYQNIIKLVNDSNTLCPAIYNSMNNNCTNASVFSADPDSHHSIDVPYQQPLVPEVLPANLFQVMESELVLRLCAYQHPAPHQPVQLVTTQCRHVQLPCREVTEQRQYSFCLSDNYLFVLVKALLVTSMLRRDIICLSHGNHHDHHIPEYHLHPCFVTQ